MAVVRIDDDRDIALRIAADAITFEKEFEEKEIKFAQEQKRAAEQSEKIKDDDDIVAFRLEKAERAYSKLVAGPANAIAFYKMMIDRSLKEKATLSTRITEETSDSKEESPTLAQLNHRLEEVNEEIASTEIKLAHANKKLQKLTNSEEGLGLQEEMTYLQSFTDVNKIDIMRKSYKVMDSDSSDEETEEYEYERHLLRQSRHFPPHGEFIPVSRGGHLSKFLFNGFDRKDFLSKMKAPFPMPTLYSPSIMEEAGVSFADALAPTEEQKEKMGGKFWAFKESFSTFTSKERNQEIQDAVNNKAEKPTGLHMSFSLKRALYYASGKVIAGRGRKKSRLEPKYNITGKPKHPYLGFIQVALIEKQDYEKLQAKSRVVPVLPLVESGKVKTLKMTHADNECLIFGSLDAKHIALMDQLKVPDFSRPYREEYHFNKYGLSLKAYTDFQREFKTGNLKNIGERIISLVLGHKEKQITEYLSQYSLTYPGIAGGFSDKPPQLSVKEKKPSPKIKITLKETPKKKDKKKSSAPAEIKKGRVIFAEEVVEEVYLTSLSGDFKKSKTNCEKAIADAKNTECIVAGEVVIQKFKALVESIQEKHITPFRKSISDVSVRRENSEVSIARVFFRSELVAIQLNWLLLVLKEARRAVARDDQSTLVSLFEKFNVENYSALIASVQRDVNHDVMELVSQLGALLKTDRIEDDFSTVKRVMFSCGIEVEGSSFFRFQKSINETILKESQKIQNFQALLTPPRPAKSTKSVLTGLAAGLSLSAARGAGVGPSAVSSVSGAGASSASSSSSSLKERKEVKKDESEEYSVSSKSQKRASLSVFAQGSRLKSDKQQKLEGSQSYAKR